MKVVLKAYLKGLKRKVYRKIEVNDNVLVKDLCEYIIVSLNGNCSHLYQLVKNDWYTYLGPGNAQVRPDEEMMDDLTIDDVFFDKGDFFLLNYSFKADWDIYINVLSLKDGYFDDDFKVIDGNGIGLIERLPSSTLLTKYYKNKASIDVDYRKMIDEELDNFTFDSIKCNDKIALYKNKLRDMVKHKNIKMRISLDGIKDFTRDIEVDSISKLSSFIRCAVLSFGGNFDNFCSLFINDTIYEGTDLDKKYLFELELKENIKFKIKYSDNFTLVVSVKNIKNEYSIDRHFVLKDGKTDILLEEFKTIEEIKEEIKNNEYAKGKLDKLYLDMMNLFIDRTY